MELLQESLARSVGSRPAGLLLKEKPELRFRLRADSVCLREELSNDERKLQRAAPVRARKAVSGIVPLCDACWPPCFLRNFSSRTASYLALMLLHASAGMGKAGQLPSEFTPD